MAENLIAVLLVTSGSRGDKLLFRYPFKEPETAERRTEVVSDNPYAVRTSQLDDEGTSDKGLLSGYTYSVLANLLAPKISLCDKEFEVTVDNLIFVGHPMYASHQSNQRPSRKILHTDSSHSMSMFCFIVTFVLQQSTCSHELITACYDLSHRIAIGLAFEEKRCHYLGKQATHILSIQDEVALQCSARPEEVNTETMFSAVLKANPLAQDLKTVFESLHSLGTVRVKLNHFVDVSFNLPLPNSPEVIQVDEITSHIRPYHAMLLYEELKTVEKSLPVDSSPALRRLLKQASPLKSLSTLAHDSDLPLAQVFDVVGHLVYWRKATIIYPLCENNLYLLSPNADLNKVSPLTEQFVDAFPKVSLSAVLCTFSLPTPLGQHQPPAGLAEHKFTQMVVWMLRRKLLVQLHTYVFLLPPAPRLPNDPTPMSPPRIYHRSHSSTSSAPVTPPVDRLSLTLPPSSSTSSIGVEQSLSKELLSPLTAGDVLNGTDGQLSAHGLTDELARTFQEELSNEEQKAVLETDAAHHLEDLELFVQLCPYFRGRHHLEEIMYYANLSRSQLLMLLDKFSAVLTTCTHDEPGIAWS